MCHLFTNSDVSDPGLAFVCVWDVLRQTSFPACWKPIKHRYECFSYFFFLFLSVTSFEWWNDPVCPGLGGGTHVCTCAWGARRLTDAHFRSVARVRRRLSAAGVPVSCRLSPIGGAYGGVVSAVYGRFMARHLDGLRPSDDKIGYNNTYHNRKSFGLTVTCVMEIHTIMLFCWIEFYLTET